MADLPDPPRKPLRCKPPSFETVNAVPPAASAEPAPPQEPVPPENDVYAILRANQARDMMAGRFELEPRPRRRSKRKRDYWTLFLVGNAGFLAALGLLLRSRPDSGAVIIMVSVGAGQVLFNVALGWVMWVVMDDY